MKLHYSAAELADLALPGMPTSRDNIRLKAERDAWPYREVTGRGGKRREYQVPTAVLLAIKAKLDAQTHAERIASPLAPAAPRAAYGFQLDLIDQEARASSDREVLAQLATLTPGQARRFEARRAVVNAWYVFLKLRGWPKRTTALFDAFVSAYNAGTLRANLSFAELAVTVGVLDKIARRTLQMWVSGYEKSGLAALVDEVDGAHRRGKFCITEQHALHEFVVGLLIAKPHIKVSALHEAAKARFAGDASVDLPTEHAFYRFVNTWKRDNAALFTALSNPDAWKNTYMAAFGSASENIVRLNQMWEFDSTPGDVMLLDGRHHIIGCVDVYSRRPKLLVSKTSRAIAVGALVRRALTDWGMPEGARTDNGQEYVSKYVADVFGALDVEHILCPPFQPWHKPHIERFFRTFSHGLVELLDGYIGHNVAERKELEARAAFSERLFQKDGVLEVSMTAAELQTFCDQWVDNIYCHDEHSGLDGKTPFQMAAEWAGTIRRIDNPRVLDVLLAEMPRNGGEGTVQKKGIKLDGAWFIAPELGPCVGEVVRIKLDPTDLGRIYVFNEDGAFLCIAEDPKRTGMDRREVAAKAKALQQEHLRQAKEHVRAVTRRANTDDVVGEILRHRAAEAGKLAALPRPGIATTTPGIEAAQAALNAMQPACAAVEGPGTSGTHVTKVTSLPETPAQRWARCQGWEARLAGGETLSAEETQKYALYVQSAEYRRFKAQAEEGQKEQNAALARGVSGIPAWAAGAINGR